MKSTLQRDVKNKVIAGVCSGLGNYFKLDPVFFRLFFLIIMFYGGGGLLLYILLWILLPQAEYNWANTTLNSENEKEEINTDSTDTTNVPIALLLLSAGILLLINNIVPGFNLKKLWPIILIVIGVGIILGYNKNKNSKNNQQNINE